MRRGGGRNYDDSNDKDTEQQRKLFLGGLSLTTTEETLREYFGHWGSLVDVVVMKDRNTNRSRGFGFVTYSSPEMVDEAQANRPHRIDGRVVESKRAMPREESQHPESHMMVNKIFVGGLKKNVTTSDLQQYFSRFGKVTDCEVMLWKETGESRGFGFVTFDDYDPVDKILVTKPHYLNDSRFEVKKALSKEQINESRRRQESSRHEPYPMISRDTRMGDRFERMPRGEFGSRYDSVMREPMEPWMMMESRFGPSSFGGGGRGLSGWFDTAFAGREGASFGGYGGGGMREMMMGFGDFTEQRRYGGGPVRGSFDSGPYRNSPYKGGMYDGPGRR